MLPMQPGGRRCRCRPHRTLLFASPLLHVLQRHKYNTVTEIDVKQERAKGLIPES